MTTNSNSNATERYFNLPTFLRYLHSTFLHLHLHSHFTNIFWSLASHHDSHTHLDDLFDLLGFWLCIYSLRPSIRIQHCHPFFQFSRSLLHMLPKTSCIPAFLRRFDVSHCFLTLIPYCISALASCFRNALQDLASPLPPLLSFSG